MSVFTEEKKKLLIEALSYIKNFNSKIVVIKYGGAAMIEEHLKHDFAQDIVLLQSLGMLPVIVHGGGPEVSKAMERLGQKVSFIDGLRVTSSENMKVAEMVLSGTINKEIITSLLKKPWFIPESTDLLDQLFSFKNKKEHLALVIDEYGELLGMLTLEDIIEEIVGDIDDEQDVLKISKNVKIGPYTIIGPNVKINDIYNIITCFILFFSLIKLTRG